MAGVVGARDAASAQIRPRRGQQAPARDSDDRGDDGSDSSAESWDSESTPSPEDIQSEPASPPSAHRRAAAALHPRRGAHARRQSDPNVEMSVAWSRSRGKIDQAKLLAVTARLQQRNDGAEAGKRPRVDDRRWWPQRRLEDWMEAHDIDYVQLGKCAHSASIVARTRVHVYCERVCAAHAMYHALARDVIVRPAREKR